MRLPTPLPTLPDLIPNGDAVTEAVTVASVPQQLAECRSSAVDCERAQQWQLSAPAAAIAWVQAGSPVVVVPLGEQAVHRVAVLDPMARQVGVCTLATPLSLVTTSRTASAGASIPTYTLASEELAELRHVMVPRSGTNADAVATATQGEPPCPVPVVSIAARTIAQRNRAAIAPEEEFAYQGRTADDRTLAIDRTARVMVADAVVQQLPFVPEQVTRGSGEQGAPFLLLAHAFQLHLFDTRTMQLVERDAIRLLETAGPWERIGSMPAADGFDLLLLTRGTEGQPSLLTWIPARASTGAEPPAPAMTSTSTRTTAPATEPAAAPSPASEPTPTETRPAR